MLTDFKFDGDDEWKGGDIYDPESGKTYSSFIYLKDNNTIRVRGFFIRWNRNLDTNELTYLPKLINSKSLLDVYLTPNNTLLCFSTVV